MRTLSVRAHFDLSARSVRQQGSATRPGGGAALLVGLAVNEMAFELEVVVQAGMNGREFLQLLHSLEHRPLTSRQRGVAPFDAIVRPPADFLLLSIAELVHR
jgi:hypothetical protein